MKVFTNLELLELVRADRETNLKALNGLVEQLPEPLKAGIIKLRDDINTKLKTMPPLDQVPAAEQTNYALNRLVDAYTYMQDCVQTMTARIGEIMSQYQTAQTALHGYTEKEKAGELLTKAAHETALETARADAAKPLREQITSLRQKAVALLGLPDAPADVLALEAAEFETRLTGAKTALQTFAGRGLKPDGAGAAFVKECVWLPQTALQGRLDLIKDIVPAGGGDPLLGQPPREEQTPAAGEKVPIVFI